MRKIGLKARVGSVACASLLAALAWTSNAASNATAVSVPRAAAPSRASTAQVVSDSQVPTACEGKPVSGGSLAVARSQATTTLDPWSVADNGQIFAEEQIFNGLVRPDPNGGKATVPALADSWKTSANGLVWTFHIRPNAKFSDGSPVTPDDVVYSLDLFKNPKVNLTIPTLATGIESITAVPPASVRIVLAHPVAAFLQNISIFPAFIFPKKLLVSEGLTRFFEHPVGTGAFEVKQWVLGDHITFVRNPYYWEPGKPYLSQLRFNFVTDDNTRLLDLESGSAGVAESVPFSELTSLSHYPHVRVQLDNEPRMDAVWLNEKFAPLKDLRVRQAMNLAINRNEINHLVYGGVGVVPNNEVPLLAFNAPFSKIPAFAYNLKEAKRLMAESGYPHGFTATFQFPAASVVHLELASILQKEWAQIGIKVNLQEVDQSTIADNLYSYKYQISMPFVQWTSDVLVPDEFGYFFTDLSSTGLNGFFSGWRDPTIWTLVQKAGSSTSDSQREVLWQQVQKLWNIQVPWIDLMWVPSATGIRDTVCNVKLNGLGVYRFEQTWIAR